MNNLRISFIIPLYNHLDYSKKNLLSLRSTIPQNLSYEIIMIDDASEDETADWLNSLSDPNIHKIFNAENLGYAKTNNIGVRQAKGEVLVLINNDLIFSEGWLEPMLDILDRPELNAGIVGNVQRRVVDNEIDHAGVKVTVRGQIDHIRAIHKDSSIDCLRMFAVTGACLMIRREDFINAGYFDETYLNGVEDIELCMSVKKNGKSVYLASKSVIQHHVSLSRDRASIQNEINSRTFYKKWREDIKRELSSIWLNILKSPSVNTEEMKLLDGSLTESFMMSPNLAARVIAENFISREELRWTNLIDKINSNESVEKKCTLKGIRYLTSQQFYLPAGDAEIQVADTYSVVNFYVCGKRIDSLNESDLAITIMVNDTQKKTIRLDRSANINVGIINPILVRGLTNAFKVRINFYDKEKDLLGDSASHLVAFTHFVIDDQKIKPH